VLRISVLRKWLRRLAVVIQRRDASASAPRKAYHLEGESPSLARCCLSVIESNCVVVRRGGEQLKMNNQSVTK